MVPAFCVYTGSTVSLRKPVALFPGVPGRAFSERGFVLDERDPVCGMTVEVTTAYAEAVGGQTYYFCSENCRQQFDQNPPRFGASAWDERMAKTDRNPQR